MYISYRKNISIVWWILLEGYENECLKKISYYVYFITAYNYGNGIYKI